MKKIVIVFSLLFFTGALLTTSAQAELKIKWFGQACFLITSPAGVKILTDPFSPEVGYPLPEVSPDLVLISHEHFDHNYAEMAKGKPKIIHGLDPDSKSFAVVNETLKDVKIYSVASYHDDHEGALRGKNAIMVMEIAGFRLVHLGDLGHLLTEKEINQIGKTDLLMIPIGGTYTIDPAQANKVASQLNPKLIFPMHYKTTAINLPLKPVEDFISGKTNVEKRKTNEFVLKELPEKQMIIVLNWK